MNDTTERKTSSTPPQWGVSLDTPNLIYVHIHGVVADPLTPHNEGRKARRGGLTGKEFRKAERKARRLAK